MSYGVYFTEIIAPLLIIAGFRTRLSSVVYISGALFALFLVHSNQIFSLNEGSVPNFIWNLLFDLYLG